MRWMLLLVVVNGCAWTNNNVKPAQERAAAEQANPKLREERLAREAQQSQRERAALAAGLAGLNERPREPAKSEAVCRPDGFGNFNCTER